MLFNFMLLLIEMNEFSADNAPNGIFGVMSCVMAVLVKAPSLGHLKTTLIIVLL